MAEALTYNSLVNDVKIYLERTNDTALADQIPRFIMLAENRLASELKVLGEQTPVTGSLTANSSTLPKPSHWRAMTSLNITTSTGRKAVLPRSYEYCSLYWPDRTATGEPRFYADYDYDNILIVPTPSSAYSFEMMYYARVSPLDMATQTNWFTVNAPQLLLYASMLEAHTFLKNWDQVDTWQKLYDRAMAAITHEDKSHSTDRSTTSGPV